MSMIDLFQPEDEAEGRLVKIAMARDGADEAFVYEAQIAFALKREDCEVASRLLPGATEMFDRASAKEDNEKFSANAAPDIAGLRLILSHAQGGKVAIEGGAEVRTAKLVASKKGVTVTIKFGLGGQDAAAAARLVEVLGQAVCVSTSNDQQSMFRSAGASAVRSTTVPVKVGDLVTARTAEGTIVGRVAEAPTTESSTVTIEDFEHEYRVNESEIVGAITLEGDVAALRRSYKDRCKRKGVTPTWSAVLLAGVEVWPGGKSASGNCPLTGEIMQRAFALLESGAVESIPREAGAVPVS